MRAPSCAVPAEERGRGTRAAGYRTPSHLVLFSPSFHRLHRTLSLTSSPTLIGEPPQLGRRTRSPSLTEQGTTLPSWVAPGPTAMTVASGRGDWVADEGRKMPVAVFCSG